MNMLAQFKATAAMTMASWLLSGCVQWSAADSHATSAAGATCDTGLSSTDNARLAAIEQVINEGKFYAAIAELDAMGLTAPRANLIRADALRRVDRDKEAAELYESLTQTCVAGRAHHGLGLLAARHGDQAGSLTHLRKAREIWPTDSRIRNDLGYALFLAGRIEDARFELLTALDLNPQDARAARNLVLLTFTQDDSEKARQLAKRLNLDQATVDKLALQAKQLQSRASLTPSSSLSPTNRGNAGP